MGGGLGIFVDYRWATHFRVHEQVCTTDCELLSVSFRPFHLPREFGQIAVISIYVTGPAANKITDSYNNTFTRSSDQPILILGDVNSCDLSGYLPTLHQYVDCPTRPVRVKGRLIIFPRNGFSGYRCWQVMEKMPGLPHFRNTIKHLYRI